MKRNVQYTFTNAKNATLSLPTIIYFPLSTFDLALITFQRSEPHASYKKTNQKKKPLHSYEICKIYIL